MQMTKINQQNVDFPQRKNSDIHQNLKKNIEYLQLTSIQIVFI